MLFDRIATKILLAGLGLTLAAWGVAVVCAAKNAKGNSLCSLKSFVA